MGWPSWMVGFVGFLKILCAVLLIAGVWCPVVVQPAALGLATLTLGAVLMHVKVRDPLKQSLPALTLLVLCLVVAYAHA